jgi:hypothetical protein
MASILKVLVRLKVVLEKIKQSGLERIMAILISQKPDLEISVLVVRRECHLNPLKHLATETQR